MSIASPDELLQQAGTVFGATISPGHYEGTADDYLVYNITDVSGAHYSENSEDVERTTVQLHRFFKRGDAVAIRAALKAFLVERGFSVIRTAQMYENDTGVTHVVVTASIDI